MLRRTFAFGLPVAVVPALAATGAWGASPDPVRLPIPDGEILLEMTLLRVEGAALLPMDPEPVFEARDRDPDMRAIEIMRQSRVVRQRVFQTRVPARHAFAVPVGPSSEGRRDVRLVAHAPPRMVGSRSLVGVLHRMENGDLKVAMAMSRPGFLTEAGGGDFSSYYRTYPAWMGNAVVPRNGTAELVVPARLRDGSHPAHYRLLFSESSVRG